MFQTKDISPWAESSRQRRREILGWCSNLPAVLFNRGLAVLAVATLGGIVFITRPNVVMHDIQPWMWLPLLIIIAPAQMYAQFLTWSTIFARQIPTGPAIRLWIKFV